MSSRSLEEFWAFYVGQHSKAATRRWHFFGTLSALLCLIGSPLLTRWLLLAAPLLGYGLAWYSHLFVEGNSPASFGHPIWSFLCDLRMFALMLTGQMDKEIKRLGKRPVVAVLHPL
uniref:Putative membrane protein ycf1 n=1 Tax=Anthurium amnicola TaxID=1678845 RepID=A0A1D1XNP6_9ARAE